jgi:hypothetical protein
LILELAKNISIGIETGKILGIWLRRNLLFGARKFPITRQGSVEPGPLAGSHPVIALTFFLRVPRLRRSPLFIELL